MNLNSYLKSSGGHTVSSLAEVIGASEAQVRQWQHGYAGRIPDPANSVSIERATGGAVMRWDLRPDDWHRIWPELVGKKGAPKVKVPA